MRFVLLFLGALLALSCTGCDANHSPRLEKLRPHLYAGIDYRILVRQVDFKAASRGMENVNGKQQLVIEYDLDEGRQNTRLKLTFFNKKLTSAVIVKPNELGKYTEVDEVILAEPAPKPR